MRNLILDMDLTIIDRGKVSDYDIAIVSDTHETTIKTVVSYFNIPCGYIIGHKKSKEKKKPKPFPMLEALKEMDEAPTM